MESHKKLILNLRKKGHTYEEVTEAVSSYLKKPISLSTVYRWYKEASDPNYEEKLLNKMNNKSKSISIKEELDRISKKEISLDFLSEFDKLIKKCKFKTHPARIRVKSSVKIKRVLFAHLSDTHFASLIDSIEMDNLNKYGHVEEARRLALFIKQIAEYKPEHRKDTELVLAINGDIMQGVIHDIESTAPMATQVSCAIHLLSQAITYLSSEFAKVRVICTTGNHGRFMHKSNRGRQSKQKWDGFDTILHVALKHISKYYKNVTIEVPTTPYAKVNILGHTFLVLHGDTVFNVGNPGKNISTEKLKNSINDIMSGLGKIDVVVVGHVHVFLYTVLNNGVKLVVNSSMSGIDEFCQSIGILKNQPGQQIFEVTDKYAVGDLRFIDLSEADNDSSLDSIIEPFSGRF
jgi:predicted phosphodiesterase/arsenate reductase-like glutaredoxin family protein